MPTKPADRMSSAARPPSDFESQLQALVCGATPLHLVPTTVGNTNGDASTNASTGTSAGVSAAAREDTARPHSPRDPQQCATVLLRWLDADLVVLLESTTTTDGDQVVTENRQLAYDQARAVLTEPHRWSPPERRAGVEHVVCIGERALEVDDDAWWSSARA